MGRNKWVHRHPQEPRPFSDFIDEGLLYLVNAAAFHPRGYSLALHRDLETREVVGWSLMGDGNEVFQFADCEHLDDVFAKAQALLAPAEVMI